MTWMNPEQSEVSQKEKNKYCILTHTYDFLWKFLSLRDATWCKVILLIERMMRYLEFISELEMKQNWPWLNACWRWARDLIHLFLLLGFPCGATGKESTYNGGDLGLTPGLERSPGEGKGYPLQYSVLENSMDYVVHGVAKSRTGPSNFYLLLLLLSLLLI